jgi:DNA polymerase-4
VTAWVLHVDLDEFIAAVEVRRRPELAGLPVVVGGSGDPTARGVVATASYAAREHGVGSGMPMRRALRLCPEAVFLPADHPAYDAASAEVMAVLRATGHPVQVLGWDEAFLGLSHDAAPQEPDGPERVAEQLQRDVLEATGLHCSVGIGDNKLRAKIATGFGKPRGHFRLTEENWWEVMGERPPDALWGIGARTARKLAALGIRTVAELAATPAQELADALGPTMGPWYRRLGRGVDTSPVDPTPYVARGLGHETTYPADLTEAADVTAALGVLADRVAADLEAQDRWAERLVLKVRFAPFDTRTRSRRLGGPTRDAGALAATARALLTGLADPRPVRLLGIRAELVVPPTGRNPGKDPQK